MQSSPSARPRVYHHFLVYALCVIMALLMLVLLLEASFERIQRENILRETVDSLASTDLILSETTKNLQYLALQMYFDPGLRPLAAGNRLTDADERIKSINQIHAYLATFPYVHSAYFYSKLDDTFYTTDAVGIFSRGGFFDTAMHGLVDSITEYRDMPLIPRLIPSMYNSTLTPVYTTFCYDRSAIQLKNHDVMILNVKYDYVAQHLYQQDEGSGRRTLIVDREGRVMGGPPTILPQSDLSGDEAVKAVLSSQENGPWQSGSLIYGNGDGRQFVVYMPSRSTDWILIRSIPYAEVFGSISTMRNYSILIGFIALAVCVGISALTSLRVLRPVEAMVQTLDRLESEKAAHVHELQQQYLRLMLHSDMHQCREEVSVRLAWLEADINLDIAYRLFLFIIGQTLDDGELIQVKRVLQLSLQGEYALDEQSIENIRIEAEQDQLVLAVSETHSRLLLSNEYASLRRVTARVYEKTGRNVSVLISREAASPLYFSSVYAKTNAQQDLLFLLGEGSLVDLAAPPPQRQDYIFPVKEEANLLASLRHGDTASALLAYEAIIQEAMKTFSPMIVQTTLQRLTLGIRALVRTPDAEDEEDALKRSALWISLPLCRTVAEANQLFESAIRDTARQLRAGLSGKQETMIAEAQVIIDREYANRDLDVPYLAEAVRLSPMYFGKLFRRITGETVTAYIQQRRLAEAETLLRETGKSIQSIAEKTGFSSLSYFSTVFRKKHGISPNEYRRQREETDTN